MDCINKNCTITGTERMVSCWLCNGYCHLKCSGGLKARDADALLDKSKFLQWTCHNCRKIRVEFYNLFQSSRNEFDTICKDFSVLNEKLLKYGELFSKFSSLEKFVISESSSPKRKKTMETLPLPQLLCNSNLQPADLMHVAQSFPSSDTNTPQIEHIPETPIQSLALPLVNQPLANQQFSTSPIPTIIAIPETPILNGPLTSNISSSQGSSTSNISSGKKEPTVLKTIPPRKTIFASRFACDTTTEDISSFLQSKVDISTLDNISIYKMNSRNRASFKIIVPEYLFELIVNPGIWPKHAIIREFIYRDNENVRIPKAPIQSKN